MNDSHSDALVFFGATGDLAYKKIFPALQAMVKRGHLNVPVIGVAKAGWNLDQLKARAQGQPGEARRPRSRGVRRSCAACCATSTATTTTRRPSRPSARSSAPPSGRRTTSPSRPCCSGRSSSSSAKSGCANGRPRHRREAVRPRPRLGAGAQPDPARRLRRVGDLPHRPLPRQAAGPEPALLPLRQRVPGAVLEPQPRRERADHDGGGLRRPGPRRLLRRDRHHPRRGPEPPVPGPGQPGDGAAGPDGQRVDPRREGQGAEGDPAARARRTSSAASSAATGREPGVAPDSQVETFAALAAGDRLLALAGRAVLHPRRQVPAGDLHGGRRPASAGRRRCFRGCDLAPNYFRFRISPDVTIAHRRDGHGAGRGDDRRAVGAAGEPPPRRRTRWTPTSGCWATPWRATPRCSPARTTSKRPGASSIRC